MTGIYNELVERIRGEIPDLERLVQRIMRAWPNVGKSPAEQDVCLDSVSLNLHGNGFFLAYGLPYPREGQQQRAVAPYISRMLFMECRPRTRGSSFQALPTGADP